MLMLTRTRFFLFNDIFFLDAENIFAEKFIIEITRTRSRSSQISQRIEKLHLFFSYIEPPSDFVGPGIGPDTTLKVNIISFLDIRPIERCSKTQN